MAIRLRSKPTRLTNSTKNTPETKTHLMFCDLDSSIPEWIIEYPETTAIFNELGLDISCGGKSLRYICLHQGFSPQDVLQRLQGTVEKAPDRDRNSSR